MSVQVKWERKDDILIGILIGHIDSSTADRFQRIVESGIDAEDQASQLQPLKNALGDALDHEHDPAPKKRRVEHVFLLPIGAHNIGGHSLRRSDQKQPL